MKKGDRCFVITEQPDQFGYPATIIDIRNGKVVKVKDRYGRYIDVAQFIVLVLPYISDVIDFILNQSLKIKKWWKEKWKKT